MPSIAESTTAAKAGKPVKPKKPYPEFPLTAHNAGYWSKKIRQKVHYFGKWADPDGALENYQRQKDDLHAGKTPRLGSSELVLKDLANRFLTVKKQAVDAGELTPRSHKDYHTTCALLIDAFGKMRQVTNLDAGDFEQLRATLAKTRGPVALGNEINRVRIVFRYGFEAGLLKEAVRFGPAFKRPSRKVLRKERAKRGPRMFEPEALKLLLAKAPAQMEAMILLGINCGFGNADCGTLPNSALDLKNQWLDYPRPKTGIERRCPLWPETVAALKVAIAQRPKPTDKAHSDLVFLTKFGRPWARDSTDGPISQEFRKLLDELELHRPGLGFYALRHTFETIGGESKDQVAVNAIMGHADASMAAIYRERMTDERLKAVTDHVHDWLYPPKSKARTMTVAKTKRR